MLVSCVSVKTSSLRLYRDLRWQTWVEWLRRSRGLLGVAHTLFWPLQQLEATTKTIRTNDRDTCTICCRANILIKDSKWHCQCRHCIWHIHNARDATLAWAAGQE